MKKQYLLLILITVLSLVLFAGCNNGEKDPTPTEEPVNTATPEPEPTEEPTPSPEPGPRTYFEDDFSQDYEGEPALLDGWNFTDAGGTNASVIKIGEEDNKYFYISGFINMVFSEYLEEGYHFSFDAKGKFAGEAAATFIRGSDMLKLPVSKNVNGAGYFEDDDTPTKFTSTTGIGLWFNATNSVSLFVKTYDTTQPSDIGNLAFDISCTYDDTKWNNVVIQDDFEGTIKYFINDELIATVEYSNLGEYDDVFEGEKFYKNVVVKDAEGNELGSTESSFVYEVSEIAFGMRTGTLSVDNLLIKTLVVEETEE